MNPYMFAHQVESGSLAFFFFPGETMPAAMMVGTPSTIVALKSQTAAEIYHSDGHSAADSSCQCTRSAQRVLRLV